MSYAVADMWMMIYVLSLPVCLLRVRVLRYGYCLSVDISVYAFSLYSVFYVWYAHSGHYKYSTLLLCTHIVGRFFAREYLYIG